MRIDRKLRGTVLDVANAVAAVHMELGLLDLKQYDVQHVLQLSERAVHLTRVLKAAIEDESSERQSG